MIIPGDAGYPHLTIDVESIFFSKNRKNITIEFQQAHYSPSPQGNRIVFYDDGEGKMRAGSLQISDISKALQDIERWLSPLRLEIGFTDALGRSYAQLASQSRLFGETSPVRGKKQYRSERAVHKPSALPVAAEIEKTSRSTGSTPMTPTASLLPKMESLDFGEEDKSSDSVFLRSKSMEASHAVDEENGIAKKSAALARSSSMKGAKKKKKKAKSRAGTPEPSLDTDEGWQQMLAAVEMESAKSQSQSPSPETKLRRKKTKKTSPAGPPVLPDVEEKADRIRQWEEKLRISDFELFVDSESFSGLSEAEYSMIRKYYNAVFTAKQNLSFKQHQKMIAKTTAVKEKMKKARSLLENIIGNVISRKKGKELLKKNLKEQSLESEKLIPTDMHAFVPEDLIPPDIAVSTDAEHDAFRKAMILIFKTTNITFQKLRVQEYYGLCLVYTNHLTEVTRLFDSPLSSRFNSFYDALGSFNHTRRTDAQVTMPGYLGSNSLIFELLLKQEYVFSEVQAHIDFFRNMLERLKQLVRHTYAFERTEWDKTYSAMPQSVFTLPEVQIVAGAEGFAALNVAPEEPFLEFLAETEKAAFNIE
ncbi:MAG: hypothetical protein MI784_01795 [Cytophagales bacterium]|nr:hypothetical protein [Cytophagales bacterium]